MAPPSPPLRPPWPKDPLPADSRDPGTSSGLITALVLDDIALNEIGKGNRGACLMTFNIEAYQPDVFEGYAGVALEFATNRCECVPAFRAVLLMQLPGRQGAGTIPSLLKLF